MSDPSADGSESRPYHPAPSDHLRLRRRPAKQFAQHAPSFPETGIAHECIKYSRNHRLPIRFIVEDNGMSVCTDTRAAWNQPKLSFEGVRDDYIHHYRYTTRYPHAGAGVRVQF